MFRIDKNLVKLSPMPTTTVTEAKKTPNDDDLEFILELSSRQAENIVDELLSDAALKTEMENEVEPEVHTEPEIPAEPPEPAGPTEEELAAAHAAEIISQAEEKAAEIVKDAQIRADELIQGAENEAQQIRDKAHQSGYEAGETEARVDAEIAMKAELEAKKLEDDELLRNTIDAIQSERARMLGELEEDVIRLTLAIAEKIIKLTSENDDKVFESIIVNALRQMNLEGKITIRVGVREYDRFFSSGSAVFALGDGTTVTAAVIKDPALADGDCIIDSDDGTANAGIDSQLKYIELAFNEADAS